jgi:hypothetical protein
MIAKSLLQDSTFEVVPETQPSGGGPLAMRYTVELFRRSKPGVILFGHVTTHLTLEDWCVMHGFGLIRSHPACIRSPLPSEQPIDLF